MDFYAVTDSDWGWDSTGEEAPFIVLAESPEQAIGLAIEAWKKEDGTWDFDGGCFKAALLVTKGCQMCEITEGKPVLEPYWPLT